MFFLFGNALAILYAGQPLMKCVPSLKRFQQYFNFIKIRVTIKALVVHGSAESVTWCMLTRPIGSFPQGAHNWVNVKRVYKIDI